MYGKRRGFSPFLEAFTAIGRAFPVVFTDLRGVFTGSQQASPPVFTGSLGRFHKEIPASQLSRTLPKHHLHSPVFSNSVHLMHKKERLMAPERVQKIRRKAGLTQEELGEVLEVSRSAVAQWESGANRPSKVQVEILKALERELKQRNVNDWKTSIAQAGGALSLAVFLKWMKGEYE